MDYVGIDLHKNSSQVCILTEDGELIERRIKTERGSFDKLLGERPPARILVEASTESEWCARHLEALGHEVIVADQHLVAESLDEFDEPGAVAAGLYADDHLSREGGIEAADVIRLMIQLGESDRRVSGIAVANSLLTCVEVHATTDSHGHLLAVSCAD
jgi:hypothetical protein